MPCSRWTTNSRHRTSRRYLCKLIRAAAEAVQFPNLMAPTPSTPLARGRRRLVGAYSADPHERRVCEKLRRVHFEHIFHASEHGSAHFVLIAGAILRSEQARALRDGRQLQMVSAECEELIISEYVARLCVSRGIQSVLVPPHVCRPQSGRVKKWSRCL